MWWISKTTFAWHFGVYTHASKEFDCFICDPKHFFSCSKSLQSSGFKHKLVLFIYRAGMNEKATSRSYMYVIRVGKVYLYLQLMGWNWLIIVGTFVLGYLVLVGLRYILYLQCSTFTSMKGHQRRK